MDRSGLTAELVSAAEEKYADNVSFHWGTELKRVDLKKRYARFREVPISSATHSTAHSASSSSSSVPVGVSVQPASALSGTAASSLGKVGSSEQGTVTFNAPSTTTAPPSLGKSGISEKGVVSFYATNTAAPPSSASAPSPVPMPVPVPVPVAPRPTLAELFPAAGPVAKSLESLRFTGSSSAPAAPSTSQAEEDEETEGVQGEEVQYDLIIGADGANSTMRQLMAKVCEMAEAGAVLSVNLPCNFQVGVALHTHRHVDCSHASCRFKKFMSHCSSMSRSKPDARLALVMLSSCNWPWAGLNNLT